MPNLSTTVNVSLDLIGKIIPEVSMAMTAYSILKNIWLKTNPGKTEADYQVYLQTSSQANIDDSSAVLLADGYTTDDGGLTWKKPTA